MATRIDNQQCEPPPRYSMEYDSSDDEEDMTPVYDYIPMDHEDFLTLLDSIQEGDLTWS